MCYTLNIIQPKRAHEFGECVAQEHAKALPANKASMPASLVSTGPSSHASHISFLRSAPSFPPGASFLPDGGFSLRSSSGTQPPKSILQQSNQPHQQHPHSGLLPASRQPGTGQQAGSTRLATSSDWQEDARGKGAQLGSGTAPLMASSANAWLLGSQTASAGVRDSFQLGNPSDGVVCQHGHLYPSPRASNSWPVGQKGPKSLASNASNTSPPLEPRWQQASRLQHQQQRASEMSYANISGSHHVSSSPNSTKCSVATLAIGSASDAADNHGRDGAHLAVSGDQPVWGQAIPLAHQAEQRDNRLAAAQLLVLCYHLQKTFPIRAS